MKIIFPLLINMKAELDINLFHSFLWYHPQIQNFEIINIPDYKGLVSIR